ncbi:MULTISPECIES: transposase domain-containing protein [Mesorhizobium]|uniref:transposase domain-containing protein n=1 Tax=Mesorhizobium sp. M5C.F.Ca.IN.020.32.2.1 TaxID=2496771 RepID=UPI001FCD4657|nr:MULTISPECIES: transposase domain-containing protein [Mesorhizobium]
MADRPACQALAQPRSRQGHEIHAAPIAGVYPLSRRCRICITNNAAERPLRCVPLGRKAWLFCGSDRGGQRAAVIYALIGTAKLNDVDPQAWLTDVLARVAEHHANRLDELLPLNWRKPAAIAA